MCSSSMSKPQRSPMRAPSTKASRMRSMSARSIAFGVWFWGDQGTSETERIGQLPEASGRLSSTQPSSVEPLAPEWPSWRQILASVSAWTKSTMRFQAASASGL